MQPFGVFAEQKHVTASARGARPHDAAAEVRYLATTGWSGNEEELAATLKTFADVGTDEAHLLPTSSDLDQVRRIADVVTDLR